MSAQIDTDAAIGGKKPRPLTGYHVAAMMVAFFGVIVTVNFTMAWLASSSWTGLVVKSNYVASQQFNGKIADAAAQKSRGWKFGFEYSASTFQVSLKQEDLAPVFLKKLTVLIGRPVAERQDRELELTHMGKGVYQTRLKLEPGIWGFALNSTGKQAYHLEGRFVVSKNGTGELL